MKQKYGLQLYSVRDAMEVDFEGTLKKVADMGYTYVEFAGFFDHPAEEVKALLSEGCKPEAVSMQGLGYKEIVAYLQGECTLEEAIYILKRDTRHFAKRQLTWFKREREVLWYDKGEYENEDAILNAMLAEAKKRGIVE